MHTGQCVIPKPSTFHASLTQLWFFPLPFPLLTYHRGQVAHIQAHRHRLYTVHTQLHTHKENEENINKALSLPHRRVKISIHKGGFCVYFSVKSYNSACCMFCIHASLGVVSGLLLAQSRQTTHGDFINISIEHKHYLRWIIDFISLHLFHKLIQLW